LDAKAAESVMAYDVADKVTGDGKPNREKMKVAEAEIDSVVEEREKNGMRLVRPPVRLGPMPDDRGGSDASPEEGRGGIRKAARSSCCSSPRPRDAD
jgi:hypothetical protein